MTTMSKTSAGYREPIHPAPLLPRGREWTVDDLDQLPDDGLGYELLDGMLLVNPAPVPVHQRVLGKLYRLLADACPVSMEVFVAPLDWRPDRQTSLRPDVLVARTEDIGPKNLTRPLVLAVEVLSPSTRRKDRLLKLSTYQDAGVENYWIVDPDPVRPSIVAYHLESGSYAVRAEGIDNDVVTLTAPFSLEVVPSQLVVR
jgi:Uma2 family endonuclease